MKRNANLRDLSDDHHQALVIARRANRAAAADEGTQAEVWAEITRIFEPDLAPHFAIEEQYVLPALERTHAHLVQRTLDDHVELRHLVCEAPYGLKERLARFGSTLHDHVRFEERKLFPAFETEAGDDALRRVAAACKRQRQS
tara:strand:+ start:44402 stop:44830 length:429 start_codon:yes stop_codon:yes gene_type:complete